MVKILKRLVNDVLCAGRCTHFLNIQNDELMDYFRCEYKGNARPAYDYWKSTGKVNYSN